MNRVRAFLGGDGPDWAAVRQAGERAAQATTIGGLWWALADIAPGLSPYHPVPDHLKIGDTPEAALFVLLDGLRDGLNAALERADRREAGLSDGDETSYSLGGGTTG